MNKRFYKNIEKSLVLLEKEVHIWQVDMQSISATNQNNLKKILSSDELIRAGKFRFDKDRDSFIRSTGLLRLLLQIYTDIHSDKIMFEQNKYGKPEISRRQNINNLSFNLSNSQNLLCIGFIINEPIGVDIEVIKPIKDYLDVAENFFSDSEIRQLKSFAEDKSLEAFYTCWTGKEAFIKYLGEGLSHPLKEFEVQIKNLDVNKTFRYSVITKSSDEKFFVEAFKFQKESVGAFALKDEPLESRYFIIDEQVLSINNFINDTIKK